MERKNLIGSARTVMGLSNRATSHRGIKLAPLLLVAVMLAAGAMGGIHMALDRPVHAPEAADGTTEPAVALHAAPWTAVHDGLAQMFTPPDFWPRLAGGRS